MMTNTTIYGYYMGDGYAVCPSCYDPEGTPDHKLPGTEGAYPLYSIDDNDEDGLTCDDCGGIIFESTTSWETDEVIRWIDNDEYLGAFARIAGKRIIAANLAVETEVRSYLEGHDGFDSFDWYRVDWYYVVAYIRT